jgi:hypothetical protein
MALDDALPFPTARTFPSPLVRRGRPGARTGEPASADRPFDLDRFRRDTAELGLRVEAAAPPASSERVAPGSGPGAVGGALGDELWTIRAELVTFVQDLCRCGMVVGVGDGHGEVDPELVAEVEDLQATLGDAMRRIRRSSVEAAARMRNAGFPALADGLHRPDDAA